MRFGSNLVLAVIGGLVVTCSLTFSPAVTKWIALGAGCAAVIVTSVAFATRGRGTTQRIIDALVVPLGGWTIVASVTFVGGSLRWLSFSEGAALWALAVAGLIAHEVLMQRELGSAADAAATSRDGRAPADMRRAVPGRPEVAA